MMYFMMALICRTTILQCGRITRLSLAPVSATAAATAITTASAAIAAATTATASASTLAAKTAAPTTTASGLWSRFVHGNGAAIHLFAVHGGNSRLRFRIAAHFDKAETFGAPCIAIDNDLRRLYRAMCTELLFQVAIADVVA